MQVQQQPLSRLFFLSLVLLLCRATTSSTVTVLEQSSWVERAATKLIVGFAQVREDPQLEARVLDDLWATSPSQGRDRTNMSILLIASGGDTAAYLAGIGKRRWNLSRLTVVDTNPAQLVLTRLKLQMLQQLTPAQRLDMLGQTCFYCDDDNYSNRPPLGSNDPRYAEIETALRRLLVQDIGVEADALGPLLPLDRVARIGLDFVGRYEALFTELRSRLAALGWNEYELLQAVFDCRDASSCQDGRAGTELGTALETALEQVMKQSHLERLFGANATANRVQSFAQHFLQRLRAHLADAATVNKNQNKSPFLAQMLLGRFWLCQGYDWHGLAPMRADDMPEHLEYVSNSVQDYLAALEQQRGKSGDLGGGYDLIQLSNILDWLSADQAEQTLVLAARALKPNGALLIRQLNSNLDLAAILQQQPLGTRLWLDRDRSASLLASDRSFFYRAVYMARRLPPTELLALEAMSSSAAAGLPGQSYMGRLIDGSMSLGEFRRSQGQFAYAVDHFAIALTLLMARLPDYTARLRVLDNIVEEHGHFDSRRAHPHTFRAFLASLPPPTAAEVSESEHEQEQGAAVAAFNLALSAVAAYEPVATAAGCFGIIEYTFADLSSQLADAVVVHRRWVPADRLVHYSLHARLDRQHAAELFALADELDTKREQEFVRGLQIGLYIFDRLYRDM